MDTLSIIFATLTLIIDFIFGSLNCCFGFLTILGVIFTFNQVRTARNTLKAQMHLRIIEEWRDPNVYRSMRYIDSIRKEWKKSPITEWENLAEQWVIENAPRNLNSSTNDENINLNNWIKRRTASQFLSKMYSLFKHGELDAEILFQVDPEVGRQLSVLILIENAIQKYFSNEEYKIDDWDQPFPKWEFFELWNEYQIWYNKKGKFLKNPIPNPFTKENN